MRNFNRTAIDAEKEHISRMNKSIREEANQQIFTSINHLLISFEKILDNTTSENIELNKEYIDNVYYHIGAIKACLNFK
jgi:hypothetical protein